jgi:uncharacterized protein DUF1580
MPDLLQETRISLTQLARQEGVSIPTTWRWAMRGIRGIRLETIQVGGRRYTSLEAYSRAVARWTDAANETATLLTPPTNREKEVTCQRTERELDAAGI